MTPRVKRSVANVIDYLEPYGVPASADWLPTKAGRMHSRVMFRCFVWEHLRQNNPAMSLREMCIETKCGDHTTIMHGIKRAPYWRAVLRGEIVPYEWRKRDLTHLIDL